MRGSSNWSRTFAFTSHWFNQAPHVQEGVMRAAGCPRGHRAAGAATTASADPQGAQRCSPGQACLTLTRI